MPFPTAIATGYHQQIADKSAEYVLDCMFPFHHGQYQVQRGMYVLFGTRGDASESDTDKG